MLMSLNMALHMKISMMVLILSPLATVHLFSSAFITTSTQQLSTQQTGTMNITLTTRKATQQMINDTVTTPTFHTTEISNVAQNYNHTLELQNMTTVKSVLINTADVTTGNTTSRMLTSSTTEKFVGDEREDVTTAVDVSNITYAEVTAVAIEDKNVTELPFGMSSNYQRNADETNFTTIAEPENTEEAVETIGPKEMPLSPSFSSQTHSETPSSLSTSTLAPEEPSSQETKRVEVEETSTPIEEQRKVPGRKGTKLHKAPTEQTKQKNESSRWIFFGVAGFSLAAAIASATILALTYTGVILAPPRKPAPPNVLPPAIL